MMFTDETYTVNVSWDFYLTCNNAASLMMVYPVCKYIPGTGYIYIIILTGAESSYHGRGSEGAIMV